MRSVIYWLMGDRAGRVIYASWNWLWGKPIEQGGKLAVEVAQESLHAMQQSVYQLTEAVSKAIAAYERAKQQFVQKQTDAKRAELQATQAFEQGHEAAARLAMTRAIELERVLPRFEAQVQQAEQAVHNLKDKLHQERQKLESYQVQMQSLIALAEVNEALSVIADINGELKIDSARNQFQEAQAAIEGRNIQVNAFQKLAENPVENLQSNLDQISLDSEIQQRLLRLKSTQSN
ncbi:PspA/IM30 family protein [Leptolyngbya boryana CZ1]|uniref:PspA/IM30 family protein n=1 Tax=Leptolyngbya boryana CZ1 TaxID=3060204 RepID=A0AA96WYF8_LEPBY|nr:PspA/IM30 family protein [Leptolyngbya boryana]WNZ47657.1 PspA/IM30 family protein [Leptolyngbya boryana CZ1]